MSIYIKKHYSQSERLKITYLSDSQIKIEFLETPPYRRTLKEYCIYTEYNDEFLLFDKQGVSKRLQFDKKGRARFTLNEIKYEFYVKNLERYFKVIEDLQQKGFWPYKDGYFVSEKGKIYNLNRKKYIEPYVYRGGRGDLYIPSVSINRIRERVANIVKEVFYDFDKETQKKYYLRHKNGDIWDFSDENLQLILKKKAPKK